MKTKRTKQLKLFKNIPKSYGGSLLTTRKGRAHGRPISTTHSMHFVLRSTRAVGDWSFRKHQHPIRQILERFAKKYGIRLHSMANVGNHLHIHMQLGNRRTYSPFIRAITSAIMMKVTGASRWKRYNGSCKFWDRRPWSRVVMGYKACLILRDYVKINQLEGHGYTRDQAHFMVNWDWSKAWQSIGVT